MNPPTHVVVLGSDWYWEQDAQLRFARVGAPPRPTRIDALRHLGQRRWELPGARALTMTWEEHQAVLTARLPFHDFQYAFDVDGEPRSLSVSGEPMFGAGGEFLGYRGTARDVTSQWLERSELQDARTLLGVAAALGRFGAWSIDVRTGRTRWTEQARAIHQLPLSHESGPEDVLDRFAPEYRAALQESFQRCAREGTPYDLEVEALTAQQERLWVRVIGVPVHGADGSIVRVQGAFQDIHKSKVAAEQQRRLAERLRVTLDSLTDGFATLDRQWRLTYVNPAAFAMLRLAPGVVGRSLWELFPQARDSAFEENYRAAMERGEERRFDAFYRPLGLWLRASAFPSEQGIAVSFSDITAAVLARKRLLRENEELERRVGERTEQLQALNQELTNFTVAVAHDLRAPLAGIAGFARAAAERVAAGPQDDKLAHWLSRIEAGASRMDDLLQGLVELSRIGRAEIVPQPVDLTALARDSMEALRAATPERQVSCSIQEGLRAQGDRRLLRTVIENLLGNAWKFTAVRPLARIEVGCDGEGRCFVRDNGAGFAMQRAGELFTPFQRLHAADEFQGLGIGLASARRVVERHGGRIWAESQEGVGSVFWFTLPGAGCGG